jgi:hypothetical protein
MNELIQLALEKHLAKVNKKSEFKPEVGVHQIDQQLTLLIKGTLTKGADGEKTPTVAIPYKLAFGLFLERAGLQREGMMDLLVEAMTEALEIKDKGEAYVADLCKNVELAEQRVKEMLDKMPKIPTSGPTTVNLTVEEVQGVQGQLPFAA